MTRQIFIRLPWLAARDSMCFQSKMLQVDSTTARHVFTVRTLRRSGSQGVLQPKINLVI